MKTGHRNVFCPEEFSGKLATLKFYYLLISLFRTFFPCPEES
jgi:hypothetical protein